MQKRIVIPGGSGFLGQSLAKDFGNAGAHVTVLTRKPNKSRQTDLYNEREWDGKTLGDWAEALDGADAVVNMAGRSVNCRYTVLNRMEIYASRLDSTRILGTAIRECHNPPDVWINSSSATVYRHADDRPQDEITGELGNDFSPDVVQKWERTFFAAVVPPTVRKTAIRTAIVIGNTPGGAFDEFRKITRVGLGGTMAAGTQRVSWIHETDFCRAVDFLITRPDAPEIVNVCAPDVLTNAEFMRSIRRAYRVPIGLPAMKWMLQIGARVLGTETELLLKSRWVVPTRLLAMGFEFTFPTLESALHDLAKR